MQEVMFEVETITPLFLAGANQATAELRVPTLRGLMRYWHRALIGGIIGAENTTLSQVKKIEADLFGTTDTASIVRVKLSDASEKPRRYQKEGLLKVEEEGQSKEKPSGKDYLLWSMAESGIGKPTHKPDRYFFPGNTKFNVTLSSRGDDDTKFQQAVVAFWLLTHLGGIGSRSRRCAGSLVAQLKEGSGANLSFAVPRDVTDLKNQLHDDIIASQAIAKKSMTSLPTASISAAAFDALASSTCKIWILCDKNKSWSTSDEAMRALGEKLRDYRSSLPLSDREVFGLPLRGNKARRASPLLLRVTRLEEGSNVEYVGVAILFKTDSAQPYHLIEAWANRFSGKEDVTF